MRERHRDNLPRAMGLGVVGTAGLGLVASFWIDAGTAYVLKAVVIFAALMGAVAAVSEPHPFPRFGAANSVTTLRAMLVALVAASIGQPLSARSLWGIIGVATVIALLDGVDGWLSRRTRMASSFGARFDMETDAMLILVLSILVWQQEKAAIWVLLCGLTRYGFVAAGWLLPWLAQPLRSTRRGKTVAVMQVVGLNVALGPIIPVPLSAVVAAVTLVALAWSFGIDVMWLASQRRSNGRGHKGDHGEEE